MVTMPDALLLPDNKKLRMIYAYLLMKSYERKTAIVCFSDVKEALAIAGIAPERYQVKKYLIVLTNFRPPLLKFQTADIFESYFRILAYDQNLNTLNILDVSRYVPDLLLILCDEPASSEHIQTFSNVYLEKLKKSE